MPAAEALPDEVIVHSSASNGAFDGATAPIALPAPEPPAALLEPRSPDWGPLAVETTFYVLLGLASAGFRLWDLAPRAYHHDESLHAYYSWVLYTGGGFMHNPLMHGPFLFDVTALGFLLFGDNLAAPRVFAALFGVALVLMPLLLRERLGRWGAMAAATLLAISPSIFYFSRFIREDIFTIVFELAVVVCVWRYIDTRSKLYILLFAASLAFLFSTKETSFIMLAIVGSFLVIWTALARPSKADPKVGLIVLMTTFALPLTAALIGFLVQEASGGDIILVNDANNWQVGAVGIPVGGKGAMIIATLIGGTLFIAAAAIGLAWRPGLWAIAFAIFYGIFVFLHTTGFTNMVGIGSGVWQSLGYWIAQQSVERGGQPWYYYLILLPLYETLAFSLGLLGVAAVVRKLGLGFLVVLGAVALVAGLLGLAIYQSTGTKALYAPLAVGLVVATWLALRRGADPFEWFLVYWIGMGFLLYVVAGEKMPWLVTHLALPLALLAGKYIGQVLSTIEWRRAFARGGLLALIIVPGLIFSIRALTLSAQWERSPIGIWSFVGPLLFASILLFLTMWLWGQIGRRALGQLVLVSVIAVLGFFTLRSGFQAAFAHGDVPVEMLVYTQTSPQVHDLALNIDRLARETGKGKDLSILIDTADGFAWPWHWYLRGYKQVSYPDMTGQTGPVTADVVVMNARNTSAMFGSEDAYYTGTTIPFRQWFPENYRNYTPQKFAQDLFSTDALSRMLNYYTYRKLGEPLGHIDSVVYYSRSLSDQLPGGGGLLP